MRYNLISWVTLIKADNIMKKRNTVQRSLVLKAVKELRCHATADEVYDTIIKSYPDISRGTAYRNLNLLSDIGEIGKVEIPSGADRYDHLCHRHYHARCLKCGRVFDVEMDFIADLERSIKNTQGFEFTGHDIIFKGICLECNKYNIKGD
jgi:Fur family ferric uptake transcriptional regulator/Fur family peroxide stress response transcriptional regulator